MVDKSRNIKFMPYDTILIGSNEVSCRYLININGFYPIIIGKGEIPHIWIYAMIRDNEIVLVNDSKKSYDRIEVDIDKTKKEITIKLKDIPQPDIVILSASFDNERVFNIKKLDLTPIGLSVISDEEKLMIGTNCIKGNIVQGVDSFIGLSDK
jgi:hypothetical protein